MQVHPRERENGDNQTRTNKQSKRKRQQNKVFLSHLNICWHHKLNLSQPTRIKSQSSANASQALPKNPIKSTIAIQNLNQQGESIFSTKIKCMISNQAGSTLDKPGRLMASTFKKIPMKPTCHMSWSSQTVLTRPWPVFRASKIHSQSILPTIHPWRQISIQRGRNQ